MDNSKPRPLLPRPALLSAKPRHSKSKGRCGRSIPPRRRQVTGLPLRKLSHQLRRENIDVRMVGGPTGPTSTGLADATQGDATRTGWQQSSRPRFCLGGDDGPCPDRATRTASAACDVAPCGRWISQQCSVPPGLAPWVVALLFSEHLARRCSSHVDRRAIGMAARP